MCGSRRRLVLAVIALLFLDSFVDLCAMGNHCWWAGPSLLIEWKWQSLREDHLLYKFVYAYWACTWGMQVPLRRIAMARTVSGGWGRQFLFIALGLNLIWATAPQDVLFLFVWLGFYNAQYPYFSYLPPEGFWNLWNMLFLRVPIGVAIGALLIRASRHEEERSLLTTALLWFAMSAIVSYAAYFIFILLRAMIRY